MTKPIGMDIFEDAKKAAAILGDREAIYLVNLFNFLLETRVGICARLKTIIETPNKALTFLLDEIAEREKNARIILDIFTDNHPVGNVLKQIKGIGPVISAGFVAHVDMTKINHFSQILSYGGYTKNSKRQRGKKLTYNPDLKKVFVHMGRSFQYSSGYPDSYFGWHYKLLKRRILNHNENGFYKDVAKSKIQEYNFDKSKSAYKSYSEGKLPAGHVIALAKFKTVCLFVGMAHYYWSHDILGRNVKPYPFVVMGHDIIEMRTMQEAIAYEEQKREEIKREGDRKLVSTFEEYLLFKEAYLGTRKEDESEEDVLEREERELYENNITDEEVNKELRPYKE
jgi:hypothetical protein